MMNISDNVSVCIQNSFIWHNSLYDVALHLFYVLYVSYKVCVCDFFCVYAPGIPSAQNINKILVSNKVQIVENSYKLFSGYKTALCPIIILQLLFNKDSLAGNHPFNVR